MMYILSSSPDIAYFSIYCDQLKRRSWSSSQSVSTAIRDLSTGHCESCGTLQDAIKDLADNTYVDTERLKVYSQDDYPELFI